MTLKSATMGNQESETAYVASFVALLIGVIIGIGIAVLVFSYA